MVMPEGYTLLKGALWKKKTGQKYQAQLGLQPSLIYRKIIDRESQLKHLIVQVKHELIMRCVAYPY